MRFVPVAYYFLPGLAAVAVLPIPTVRCFQPSQSAKAPPEAKLSSAPEGTWATCEEISGFSGTVLAISGDTFTEWFYSDCGGGVPVTTGTILKNGDFVALKRASDEPAPFPEWKIMRIQGVPVMLRSDALMAWKRHKRLYDYGILIKVSDAPAQTPNVNRPTIRLLYDDPGAEWRDPFVYGSNAGK